MHANPTPTSISAGCYGGGRQLFCLNQGTDDGLAHRCCERRIAPWNARFGKTKTWTGHLLFGFHGVFWFSIERLSDAPKFTCSCSHFGTLQHLVVEHRHAFVNAHWLGVHEGWMNMTGAFLDGSIVANTVQLLVLANEPLVVAEAGLEFIGETNHIPVVGDLLGPVLVQANAPASKLVDAHVGGHGRQIDQHVDTRSIPSLAHEATRPNQASGETLLKEFGDHGGIIPWYPVLAGAGDFVVATHHFISKHNLEMTLCNPCSCFFKKSLGEVVVHQHGAARHQDGVKHIAGRARHQMTKGGDSTSGLIIEHIVDEQGRGSFLKVGDDHGTYGVAKVLHFFLEDGAQRLTFAVAVGKNAIDGGCTRLTPSFRDLGAQQPVLLGGTLSLLLVVGVGRSAQAKTYVSGDNAS